VPAAGPPFNGAFGDGTLGDGALGPAGVVPGAAAGPPVGFIVGGATRPEAEGATGLAPSLFGTEDWIPGDWITDVDPATVGATRLLASGLLVSGFGATGSVGALTALAACSTASEGLEPPLPPRGAALLVAGATVVDGAVVLGVTGGVVVLVAPVPWTPDAAGALVDVADGASAEAGRAPRSKRSPARSAKDATHLRGLTTSILGLLLKCWDRPPSPGLDRGVENRRRDVGFLT